MKITKIANNSFDVIHKPKTLTQLFKKSRELLSKPVPREAKLDYMAKRKLASLRDTAR